ncbi:MAG: lysophospholipid acyltransferase family protein [Myxococcota bacterium]
MFAKLFRWWRIVATGSAFTLFGIGGLLAAIVFPIMNQLPGSRLVREARVQRVVHWLFRGFVQYMRAVGILDVEIVDAHLLKSSGGQLLVANHPTLLDVVMVGALVPQLDCVVKREAWSNPFIRGPIVAAGYIPNDPSEGVLDQCAERLRNGRSLLIFPEGTRSPKGGLGSLRRGAAHMALRSQRPLRPIFIGCDPPTLMSGQPWYEVPPTPMRYTIEVGPAIDPPPVGAGKSRGALARQLTDRVRDFYEERLQNPVG